MKWTIITLLVAVLLPVSLTAQLKIGPEGPMPPGEKPKPPANKPQTFQIEITPAAEPTPALKYRFDVPLAEKKPGNSVPFYYRAIAPFRVFNRIPAGEKNLAAIAKHLETPIEELDVKAAGKALEMWNTALAELETATYREETDWSWRITELSGEEVYLFLLPEIQNARNLVRVVALKARVEIAEQRYDDAERTLRMGYRLSAAIADEPIAICALVGAAASNMLDQAVIDWISRPTSPNAYWALAALPKPLIPIRPAMEYELNAPLRLAPWLEDAATDHAPAEVWRTRIVDLLGLFKKLDPNTLTILPGEHGQNQRELLALEATIIALRSYSPAKQALIKRGYDADEVAAMPVGKVLAIQENHVAQMIIDARMRTALVAPTHFDAIEADTRALLESRQLAAPPMPASGEPLPLMTALPHLVEHVGHTLMGRAVTRSYARRLALRTIEAIRMHVDATGALPKTLEDITVVPVPDNPFTGEPFDYSVDGNTAVLSVITDPGQPPRNYRFELTLAE